MKYGLCNDNNELFKGFIFGLPPINANGSFESSRIILYHNVEFINGKTMETMLKYKKDLLHQIDNLRSTVKGHIINYMV